MKTALITGIGGQDGSYLAELLLEKGYQVHGIELPALADKPQGLFNIGHLLDRIIMHYGSVANEAFLQGVLDAVRPDECYHLAAASFVSYAFDEEASILTNNVTSVHVLLGCLKQIVPDCRLFFAGTSEMFGHVDHSPQNESTPYRPRSVYGISKVAGANLVSYYRDFHGLFACTGILYNHESIRRGLQFVTRKITATAAAIKLGLKDKLILGNLDAERDWGYAPDFTRAMWLMLQQDKPTDLVIATGEKHTVRDFVSCAFATLGLDYESYVEVSKEFYRKKEVVPLLGDAARARKVLSWQPTVSFTDLVTEMVRHDLDCLTNRGSFY